MIAVSLVLFVILVYMTIVVCRMVWANEKVVPIMLITLCVTLMTLVIYFSYVIASTNNPDWNCGGSKSFICASEVCAYLPALCLANAVILNLNKWVYFKLRINAFIKVGFGSTDDKDIEGKKSVVTLSDDSESCRVRKTIPKSFESTSDKSGESAVLDMFEEENKKL